jgi:hypothetical protein
MTFVIDPADKMTALEAMVDNLEAYLESDQLYRQVVVQGARGTLKPNMTIGLMLDYYKSLEREVPNMLPRERTELQEAISKFERVRDTSLEAYTAKLRHEIKASLDSWRHFMDGCTHGDDECFETYPTEVWLRTRLNDLMDEARGLGMDVTDEVAALLELDTELDRMFQRGEFVGAEGAESEYPADRYWWLYGQPIPNP